MLSTSARGSATHRISTSIAGRLLVTAALVASSMALARPSRAGDDQRFFVLDNPGDANFNQLLGVNNAQIIVGYFGDGAVVANNGYVLVPPNHYAPENVANAAQTQAIGINDKTFPHIVGSFTDAAGGVHGFIFTDGRFLQFDAPGSSQITAFGVAGTIINGINDRGDIVGFFSDGAKVHGFARFARFTSQSDEE
jgi:hypothetical protein